MKPDLIRENVDLVLVTRERVVFEPRPAGLVDAHRLESVDGTHAVTYSRWSGPAELDGATAYRPYRSQKRHGLEPGCVVLVSAEFDRPGIAEQWVDLVCRALEAEEEPHPGGISAHFHISLDGMRMLNYAEWTSAEAHQDAMERGNGAVGVGPLWQRVLGFPGFKRSEVHRYQMVEQRY